MGPLTVTVVIFTLERAAQRRSVQLSSFSQVDTIFFSSKELLLSDVGYGTGTWYLSYGSIGTLPSVL
jgi:hypothetical protein